MYKDEKTQGFQKMILFIELFANVLGFQTFIRACELSIIYHKLQTECYKQK